MSNVSPLHQPGHDPVRRDLSAMPSQDGQGGLSLAHLVNILKRRKYLIAGIMLAATGLVALYINQITPLYYAEATIVVEPSRQRVLNMESVVSGLRPDYYTNETEAAVIGSRELARRAVVKLDLISDPLFNPDLRPPERGLVRTVRKTVSGWARGAVTWMRDLASGGRYSAEREAAAAERAAARARSPQEQREIAVETATDIYLANLSVLPSQRSRVITVRFTSPDPSLAARAANTTADIYILDQLETKGQATTRASEWLNQRASELRNRVIASERRLEEFRREAGIVEIGGASVYARQRAELDSQLVAARTKRAETEARHSQVKRMLDRGAEIDSVAAVLDSPLIQKLREQEAQVLRKIAELKTQLRENHPNMVLARNELKDLREKIEGETRKIITSLKSEVEIARARERNLEAEIARLQAKLDEQQEAEVTLRALESEVKANKQLYETILARLKETGVQDEAIQQPDARIISRAVEPYAPFYPRKRFMIVAALLVSAMIGVALSVLLEFFDRGFRSVQQLEAYTGLPTLGIVPLLTSAQRRRRKPHEIAAEQPGSAFGEAVRSLRTGLLLSNVEHPPRTVMITSAAPGEGKTSTALALAAMASRSGQKVIVIDCDLRHPSLHLNLGYDNVTGLGDYLGGGAGLGDIIDMEPRYGLRFITAGAQAPNPPDLLGSPRMRELLRRLAEAFDLVILDAPPLMAVSDALVLVRQVERTAFVVRWDKTPRQTVLTGLKQATEAGARMAGMILTQVDTRKHGHYEASDAGYYQYHHYYSAAG